MVFEKNMEKEKMKEKKERQEIKRTLIDTKLCKFEGKLDDFIGKLIVAQQEAIRDKFDNVRVYFDIMIDDDGGDYPCIEVEASRLETVEEMKLRKSAEEARHKREQQERYEAVMEKYKDHD